MAPRVLLGLFGEAHGLWVRRGIAKSAHAGRTDEGHPHHQKL